MSFRYLLPLALSATLAAQAQTAPVITADDMPVAGDTLRLSVAATLPAGAPALTQVGENQTWNYAGLVPTSQRVEAYNSFASSAMGLQLFYFGLGANKATLAMPQALPLPAGVTLPVPVTNTQEFFNLTANSFYSVGFGGVLNGTAVPVGYASGNDVLYNFPTTYTSSMLSNSVVNISLPNTGFFSRKRQRINRADAWGTVTTPYGTFQALRVVTSLNDHDSVQVGVATGQGFTLPLRREYKWLAKGQHVPVLTIITAEVAGVEQVTGVEYRDSYRRITAPLAARNAALEAGFQPYPSPSAVGTALRVVVPAGAGPLTLTGADVLGRQLFSRALPAGATSTTLDAATLGSYHGVLLLTLRGEQGTATRRVVRE